MADLFDNVILCKECGKEMGKSCVSRNGVSLRVVSCNGCGKKQFHPLDLEKYKEFSKLRGKQFSVKLRMVGNSYAVSIPREIIEFMDARNQENDVRKMVDLCFEEFGKLSLFFPNERVGNKIIKRRVIRR